ncbi:MAG TPA: class II aldolase/adducin family protein, partial [Candidatus Limiplasma sp.]|nr:class II aldolase/adducin family protein [Candidatus Limiplasma sp.]
MTDGMSKLIAMSHQYGGDARYVLAGGGNTSVKVGGVLYVKASGTRLSNIEESGFVQMDMGKISAMFAKPYPQDDKQREAEALQDMM